MSVWFVIDSRQTANNKAGYMGHILQHSRVISHVFYQFCSFLLFLSFCFFLVDIFACMCVMNCIVLSYCHYGVIKHNNKNNYYLILK